MEWQSLSGFLFFALVLCGFSHHLLYGVEMGRRIGTLNEQADDAIANKTPSMNYDDDNHVFSRERRETLTSHEDETSGDYRRRLPATLRLTPQCQDLEKPVPVKDLVLAVNQTGHFDQRTAKLMRYSEEDKTIEIRRAGDYMVSITMTFTNLDKKIGVVLYRDDSDEPLASCIIFSAYDVTDTCRTVQLTSFSRKGGKLRLHFDTESEASIVCKPSFSFVEVTRIS